MWSPTPRRPHDGGARGGGRAVVDSHAHLESCDAPVPEVLAEARAAGVDRVVTIGMGRDGAHRAVALAEVHPEVFVAVGVHPNDAETFTAADVEWMRRLAEHPRVVAIGECGLDFYRDRATPARQREAFSAQIAVARETGLPLVIHTREAAEETLGMLRREADGLTVVLHCFSLTGHLDEVLDRGYHTSFAGPLTYRGADDLRAAAARIPEDRLLVETDSPYLAPVPRRGRPNRPAYTAHTLARLAEVRGVDPAEMDEVTTRNTERVFARMGRAV